MTLTALDWAIIAACLLVSLVTIVISRDLSRRGWKSLAE
jgi:hypothetical protein